MSEVLRLKLSGVGLKSFTRNATSGGVANLSANLTEKIIDAMGWKPMRDHEKSVDLEGDLVAQSLILSATDTIAKNYEITIDIQAAHNFEGIRRELDGKRGKGFKHELHFKVKFADNDGCAKLERHMLKIPEGKASAIIIYTPKAVQGELTEQTDEQRQATLPEND